MPIPKKITYIRSLFFCDGPLVFEARDNNGQRYIAVRTGENTPVRYLVVGIDANLLYKSQVKTDKTCWKNGLIDLRSILENSSEGQRFIATESDHMKELDIDKFTSPLSEIYLPDKDFFLTKELLDDFSENDAGKQELHI